MTDQALAIGGLVAAIGSLVAAIAALVIALAALWRADRNSSAATLVALSEGLRAAWERYLATANEADANFQFAELVNLLELACAILIDKAVHGAARDVLDQYVAKVLRIFAESPSACDRVAALKEDEDTFKYVQRYISETKRGRELAPLLARVLNPSTRSRAKG